MHARARAHAHAHGGYRRGRARCVRCARSQSHGGCCRRRRAARPGGWSRCPGPCRWATWWCCAKQVYMPASTASRTHDKSCTRARVCGCVLCGLWIVREWDDGTMQQRTRDLQRGDWARWAYRDTLCRFSSVCDVPSFFFWFFCLLCTSLSLLACSDDGAPEVLDPELGSAHRFKLFDVVKGNMGAVCNRGTVVLVVRNSGKSAQTDKSKANTEKRETQEQEIGWERPQKKGGIRKRIVLSLPSARASYGQTAAVAAAAATTTPQEKASMRGDRKRTPSLWPSDSCHRERAPGRPPA